MRFLSKLLCSLLLVISIQQNVKAQTTLVTGDIAFTGYIGNDPALPDQFSFVLLKAVTANTVIKFTDFGWRTDLNAFNSGTNLESEATLTLSGALPAGTEITIAGNTATLVGGSSAGTLVYSTGGSFAAGSFSFPTSGDQIFAYQGTFAAPVFITGLHMNVQTAGAGANNTDAATWDGVLAGAFLNGNTSSKPAALTTGTNALWFGTTGDLNSEEDNVKFNCTPPLSPLASLNTSIYTLANWTTNDGPAAGFTLPTGCNYLGVLASAPSITGQPAPANICAGATASFVITATGAATYQWEVSTGGPFTSITNDATYSGATTPALTITAATIALNGNQYRCVATNGSGSTNSNAATLTVTALPVNPTLLAKTPNTATVADGTNVSATFNPGSGGTGCSDDFRYTTNGGASYLPYTPGSNITTTGLAAGAGVVTIEGRRANCSAGCQGGYVALATWIVTPLPASASSLNAGDIAFTGYAATSPGNDFSFVLLRNIGPGTAINFTDNGWLSTNVFGTGETTVTWTSNAAYSAGTEIRISGTTATLATGGSAGTVTGTALSLSPAGDQILAYRGTAAAPTFISAIHMNVTATTTAAAWDGATVAATASALPTGLTTGVNCIWIGTPGNLASEFSNSRYGNCAGPATLGPIATLRAAVNNQANWISDNNTPPNFTLPTGCNYMGVLAAPSITGQPAAASICEGANTSFTIVAGGATAYQWQVDPGTGFVNVTDNAIYSGATTATLNITAAPLSFNNNQYRCVATNGSGSTNSNAATLTVTANPVAPTLLAKTPTSATVADGTPVSATFNAGSGGTGCADDFRYTTDGGATYLPYTPGSNISTTGVAGGSGFVFIEGRRANCSAGCQGTYRVLASWRVTPDPVAATTLNAGDIAFSGYASTATPDEFSFVLLKTVGPGTVINFTDNGWLSTNVFSTGEQTVTWTAPAGGLPGGTEITIAGLTATRTGGGAAGTVSGTALSMANSGDQILAYRGTAAAPTFISAIHMNVETTTTAAAWDGALTGANRSALPTGLTTGVNAIWIGTPGNTASEFSNSRFGNCTNTAVLGSITALRALLNNQANWISDNNTPPGISLPSGCNYLSALVPSISVTGTPLTPFTTCAGTPSPEQSFVVSGSALTSDITITAPAGFEVSITSGSGFASSLSLTPSAGIVPSTNIYVRLSASASGAPSGNISVASTGVTTVDVAVTGTVGVAPTTANAGADSALCSLNITLYANTPTTGTGAWSQVSGPGTTTFGNAALPNSTATVSVGGVYIYRWTISSASCPSSTDDVQITFSATPTVASAGADRGLCLPSSALNMAGNTPAVGTGTWTQINGPVAATITNANNPVTSVTGMNTAGTYTFVWTITNAPCPASTDTMTVTVATTPAGFSIVGSTTCQGDTVTLTGPSVPNVTYTWQRSLSGITNSYVTFGGTAQTQQVTTSGNYQLIVSNAAGCAASDTAVVHIADYRFTGSIGAGDPSQTGRINRLAQTSVCPGPKAFPGMFVTTGARLYDSYTITNVRPVPVCATVGIASGCGVNIFTVAYSGSFNPADPSQNYLGDPGSSFPSSGFMEITIPANGTVVLVVHEVNTGTGCANYMLTVDVPRDPAAITVNPTPPICSGGPVTLTGAVANTYLWAPGGATTQAPVVNPIATTTYNVTYGYGNVGCTRTDAVNVSVGSTVTTAFAGNDTATCGTVITLAANTPVVGTGAWSQVSGPGTITFGAAGSPNSTATASVTGSYTLRWTITAGAPCPGTSQDDVVVNFAASPTVANAGSDVTACVNPGSSTLSANTATVGTGAWSQVAGPVTANIISSNLPVTTITGLNTPGTYTFRWTISNAPCPASFDEVNVVVNSNPATPTITGGGTFCPAGTTLSTPSLPNHTYVWGRSFLTAPFTGIGTANTQVVTASGNYQLTVTNQFGCSASANTVVNVADYVFNGSLVNTDAQQTGRLNRFANISTCAAPKACPLTFTTSGSRAYDSYTITNPRNVPVCATIGLNSGCGTAVFSAAYSGSFNPTSLCTNYLADPGSSPAASIFYEATIPANGTIVVVVHEVNPGQNCASYTLTVDVPRDTLPITVAPNDTICTGTPLMLTAPQANTYLWTPGGATTQVITPTPVLGNNNYSVTLGYGNNGCTRTLNETVVVNAVPAVNAVPNQYFCANTTTTAIPLTNATPGTVFNWTNSNTAIGLAASGTGDIPAFTATNGTGAPISGTITVTPVVGICTGTPITFTITIPNQPSITSVTGDSVCAPGGVVNLAATGTGLIQWFDSLTNGNLLNTGATFSPNVTTTTTYYVQSQVNTPAAQTLAMPAQSNTFPGNTRGYWFTAPRDFVITSLLVPTTASSGPQNIAVVKFNGNTPPPIFSSTTNAFSTVFLARQNPSIGKIPCNISIKAGEVIGILGSRGGINTYAPGDYATTIFGQPVQLERLGMQFPLEIVNPQNLWREFGATTSISRIEFEYTNVSCNSSPRVPVVATVLPQANATATPASQTVCSGPITTIVLGSNIAGTTYTWTRNNVATVTGIPASGSGLTISGTLTNTTTAPVTVTFTITPTTPDGCTGPNITATVTVQAIPTITCPANITVNNDANICGAVVTYSPTVTGIPVPVVTYTFTGATTGSGSGNGSGSTFNIGTTNVRIIATNVCGADTCNFTVTVNDVQPPTITCPAPVTVSCAADVPAVNIGSVTANDNCPGVVVTHRGDVISGQTCANRFTVTRTYRATDASNNFVECTQVITVNDITPPVMTCPAPVTVSCVSEVPAVNINDVTGVSDNCAGAVTVTHQGDVISGQTCANRYTITRTYRATDVCGNFTECTQIITVNDQTPPVMTCPAPVTVSCVSEVPPVNINDVTGVSDNCAGVVTVTHQGDVISGQTCTNRYTITRTYRATDVCGNFTECTQIITVNDQTPPVMTCPAPVTVSCVSEVPPVNINDVTGVSDNCGGVVTITHRGDVISNNTCVNRYTITRTYRATDVCGNFTECTQIITVNDQTAPVITCPAPVNVQCAGDVPAPNTGSVTATDNCGNVYVAHVSDVISNQTCVNRFTITRTYSATDDCGNVSTCQQIITVNDITPPTITCPGDLTVSCTAEVPPVNLSNLTGITDNCGGTIANGGLTVVHVGDVITNQTCANRYTITRTYRVTDECGNFTNCTQVITVNDQTAPTMTCPAPVSVSCASQVPAPDPGAVTGVSDNCGGTVTVTHVSDVITNQVCANKYTITRTYRATDACGNFSQCIQTINVNDTEAPVITCPAPVTVSCAGLVPLPTTNNVTATDNCGGGITITHRGDVITSQTCANRYVIQRTFRATDLCGNFSECVQIITVNDQIAPVINTPANITVNTPIGSCNAVVNFAVTATDNCGQTGLSIVSVPASGSTFPIGTTPITITATDICGNVSTSTFNITVIDAQRPVITTQPTTQTVCVGSTATFSVASTNALGYQWQRKLNANWFDIPNQTGPSYTINLVPPGFDNDSFRVVITGRCTTIVSNHVALRVNPLPNVNITPQVLSLVPGQTGTLTATATPAGGTFVWVFNGVPVTNATGPVLGPLTVDDIGAYRVIYTDPNGCVNRSSSDAFVIGKPNPKLWIYPNPSTGQFQVRYYNTKNEPAFLSIFDRSGRRVFYQRFITGANAYSRLDVDIRNQPAGTYVVEVTNGGGVKLAATRIVKAHR